MRVRLGLLLLLAGVASAAAAAEAPAAPAAELFFQTRAFTAPQVSPDGRRLAALTRHDHRHYALTLLDLATGKGEVLVKETRLSVVGFAWKSDDLLLIVIANDEPRYFVQSVDLRTRKVNPLDRLNRERTGQVASYTLADPNIVICPWADGSLRRVDIRTGKSEQVERAVPGINRWIFDPLGTAWAGFGYLGEKWIFVWRTAPGAPWQRREQPGLNRPALEPLALMPDRKRLVVLDRVPNRPDRLAYFDLATGATEELFQHDQVDVTGLTLWGRQVEPAAANYVTDRARQHAFLPEAAAFFKSLAEALPDAEATVISFSTDNQKAVVEASNDRDPGTFYLLDRATGRLGLLGRALPSLPSDRLVPTRWLEFKTRDGLTLKGRLTVPAGVTHPPVLVRLGPGFVGPRIDVAYDAVAQFLASRGFATVRFHVRGTDGLGLDFLRAGDLKITTGVVDDLEDGIAALTAAGEVDTARLGLLGVGDGGITALHALARLRGKVLVNLNTPMTVRHRSLASLSPSDRDDAELTRMLGGSAAAVNYVKSLDPLKAAAQLRVPSFHSYPRGYAGHEMTEDGRLLQSALARTGIPATFHLEGPLKPETDQARVTGERFEAIVAFLRRHL